MRVAVIVVFVSVLTTASEASKSCMSKTEARQHFGSVHIYWHGADRCWDASPTSPRYQIQARQIHLIHEVPQKRDQPKWHDSMSKMLADDEPEEPTSFNVGHPENDDAVGMPWINRWVDIGPADHPLEARWVDIPHQNMPLSVIQRKPEPMISPHVVLLMLIAVTIALTLATIEIVFRRTASN